MDSDQLFELVSVESLSRVFLLFLVDHDTDDHAGKTAQDTQKE